MKKTLFLTVFLLCVLALLNCASADIYGDFEYDVRADGVYITRYLADDVHIVVPDFIDGVPVVSLRLSNDSGYWTEPKAQSVTFPSSVTRIEDDCFRNYSQLESISSLENVTYIGDCAFQSCIIKEFVLSSKLFLIGSYAFDEEKINVSITLPDSYLHANLNHIGHSFDMIRLIETGDTPRYKVVDNVLFTADMKTLVLYPRYSPRTYYRIPDGVETIEVAAFEANIRDSALLEVQVPDSVRTIYPRSFGDVTGVLAANFRPGLLVTEDSAAYRFAAAAGIPFRVMETGTQTLAERVAQIIGECTNASMNDYAKALALHDWLILNCEYDNTLTVYSAYGALFQGTGVCEAYSNAYRLLLTEAGIPNTVIRASNHQWNLAYIENAWYHIDCTNDDDGDTASHRLFCLPDDLIRPIYDADSDIAADAISGETNSLRWNYSYRNGEYDTLIAPYRTQATDRISSGETSFYLPFANEDIADGNRRSIVLIALKESDFSALLPGKTVVFSIADDFGGIYGCVVDAEACAQSPFTFDIVDGSVRITGYTGADSVVTIPDTLCGMKVTEIGQKAFFDTYIPRHITVGQNVTRLSESAFLSCWNLESVTLPSGLSSIGDYAFFNCERLKRIDLPEGLTELPLGIFAGCYDLEEVIIPQTIINIGGNAFGGCRKIESVSLPPHMTVIPNGIFTGCVSLKHVTFGNSITEIGANAFFGCAGLTSLDLPDTIKSFGDYAFLDCENLVLERLPADLEVIGGYAMQQMYAVTSLHLPEKLHTIGNAAFEESTNIACITVSEKNEHFAAVNGILYTKDMKSLIYCPPGMKEKNVVVPFGVEQIRASAFWKCKGIEKIVLPDTVSALGASAFDMCESLSEINIPSGIASLPDSCLRGTSIKRLTLPASLVSLGGMALYGTKLESLALPDSVTTLGWHALGGLRLQSFTIPPEITSFTNYEMHESYIDVLTVHENFLGFGPCFVTIGEIRGYAGTFAERYAAENNIPFVNLANLRITGISPDAQTALTGDCVQWTVLAEGNYGEIAYTYTLYADGAQIDQCTTREATYSHYAVSAGSLVLAVTAADISGQTASAESAPVLVEAAPLTITSVSLPDGAQADRAWTIAVNARGGSGRKTYGASVYLNGALAASAEPQSGNEIPFTVHDAGQYDVLVEVRDEAGNEAYWRAEGFVVERLPLAIVDILPDAAQAVIGTTLRWVIRTEGGASGNTYAYSVLFNEAPVWESGVTSAAEITWLAENEGAYAVRCSVLDGDGNTAAMTGGQVAVTVTAPLRFTYADLVINKTEDGTSPIPSWNKLVAYAKGGVGEITYSYYVYLDLASALTAEKVKEHSSPMFAVTRPSVLSARIDAYDEADHHISVTFGPLQIVNPTQLSVSSIIAHRFNPKPGDDIGWSVSSKGGYGEKLYRYELFRDDVLLTTSEWTSETDFSYADAPEGSYILRVTVKDERNAQAIRRSFATSVKTALDPTLYLPAKLKVIQSEAFAGIAAKKAVIPPGCTAIDSRAFAGSSIELFVIPASVTSIAEDAFAGCENASIAVSSEDDYAAQWADAHGLPWHILQ